MRRREKAVRDILLKTRNLPRLCMYCGEPASDKEHVFPKTYYRENTPKVWSCGECNGFAGYRIFESITDKRFYIHEKIREKYDWAFKTPKWDEEDILELGENVRSKVREAMRIQKWVEKRLSWSQNPIVLIAEKYLEKRVIGKGSVQMLAELPPTELKEMRLLVSTDDH